METTGEMRVTAQSIGPDGKVTRGAVLRSVPLEVEAEEIDTLMAIGCGFQQEWISGTGGGFARLEVCCGAGLGSPWMTFTIKRDGGEERHFRLHGQRLINALLIAVGEEVPR